MNTHALPPVSLIHIGLPKTASTFIQTAWGRDPAACLVQQGVSSIIDTARERALEPGAICPSAPAQIYFDVPYVQGQKLILSNEALSGAYLNERASPEQIRAYQELAAAHMKRTVPKSKILIVTRSPEKLVPSIYNQAVKQGSVDTYEQFLHREKGFIEQALNIRDLFTIWRSHYGADNVLLLPMELLRDDPERFYKEVERFSGVPAPQAGLDAPVNTALAEGHLDVMRYFNKWVEMITQHGIHEGKPPPHVQQALMTLRFDVRYSLESPTPALARRLRLLERKLQTQSLTDLTVPRPLLKTLRSSYGKQLKKNDFYGYRKLYT